MPKIQIGALISGSGTNLQAVMAACDNGAVDGRVVFVGSDNPGATGLARAEQHDIPTFVVDYAGIISLYGKDPEQLQLPPGLDLAEIEKRQALFAATADPEKRCRFITTRVAAEYQMLKEMEKYAVDLIILAGFMRNLTPYFIDAVNRDANPPRIMNIHPALLPSFPGVDGYGDTYRYGCKVGGCTVHFVDYGEDSGPIIGQKCFAISDEESLDTIRKRGLEKEWALYPECIQLFAENRLRLVPASADGANRRPFVKIG